MPAVGAASFWMNGCPAVEPLRAERIPMLLAAIAFASGILLARQWHTPAMLTASLAALLGLSLLSLRCAPRAAWWSVLALWTALGCWCAQVETPVARQPEVRQFADGLSRTVRGRVVAVSSLRPQTRSTGIPQTPAEPWMIEPGGWEADKGQPAQGIDLALDAVEQLTPDISTLQPLSGGLRLTVAGSQAPLHCGDEVEVAVRLRVPEIYRDPGAWSYSDWLLGQGIGALASVRADRLKLVATSGHTLRCGLLTWQHWAASRIEELPNATPIRSFPSALRLSPADTAMLGAMLFGDRTALTAEQRAGFERTGTFHLFVVSGLHVALLTGALFWLLRRLRLPEYPAVALAILCALGYALLTGFGVPVQRALAMSSLYLVARALDRQRSGLNALGVAALLILVADPRALFQPSFQMTALVILAVSGLAVPVGERLLGHWRSTAWQLAAVEIDIFLHHRVAAHRVRLRMWGALCGDLFHPSAQRAPEMLLRALVLLAEAGLFSVAIELCMALPMAFTFHRVVPLALPGNLLVTPLAPALALGGVLTFVASLFGPWLAAIPALWTALLLHTVQAIVGHLGDATLGDIRLPGPSLTAVATFGCAAAFAIWALRSSRPTLFWAGLTAGVLLPVIAIWPAKPALHPGTLELTAIDVGQGDSLLVVSPDGRTMLVDAGGPVGHTPSRWDVGEQVVAPFLWSRHLRRLDVVVISHAHSDHIGGIPAVLRDLRPRELWLSIQPGESPELKNIIADAQSMGVAVRFFAAGERFAWGPVQTTVLSPEPGYANPGQARNDDSLVLRLDWRRASILLEGDAEATSEDTMIAHSRIAPVTVLKIGHHGSRTSTNPAFLAAASPGSAVISVGQHNTFGHPRAEVLERLEAAHVKTYRTDSFGAETLLVHADGSTTAEQAYN